MSFKPQSDNATPYPLTQSISKTDFLLLMVFCHEPFFFKKPDVIDRW